MKRFVFILVAVMAVAGIAFAQDAPKEPPKKDDQASAELRERIGKLIVQLGDKDVKIRDSAQAELIKIGKPALAQLDKAIMETNSIDVRDRITAIVAEARPFTLIGKNKEGYEEYRHQKTGMVFVLIPAGKYKMGLDEFPITKPVHEVKLYGFLIAKYEVTQAVWEKVMGNNPSHWKGHDNPVEGVSWDDCQEFCKKTGLRLPTEAEWEYASRAGITTKYYWGDEPAGDYMWYNENANDQPQFVGKRKANGFGLYDMCGNVDEWCQDWFAKDYYEKSPLDNPKGPDNGTFRVRRGGSYLGGKDQCCSGMRDYGRPTDGGAVGLRCTASK